jgi:hypothetical protein
MNPDNVIKQFSRPQEDTESLEEDKLSQISPNTEELTDRVTELYTIMKARTPDNPIQEELMDALRRFLQYVDSPLEKEEA